jgi:hypothetical protein
MLVIITKGKDERVLFKAESSKQTNEQKRREMHDTGTKTKSPNLLCHRLTKDTRPSVCRYDWSNLCGSLVR